MAGRPLVQSAKLPRATARPLASSTPTLFRAPAAIAPSYSGFDKNVVVGADWFRLLSLRSDFDVGRDYLTQESADLDENKNTASANGMLAIGCVTLRTLRSDAGGSRSFA
jgi:hypothetical protein